MADTMEIDPVKARARPSEAPNKAPSLHARIREGLESALSFDLDFKGSFFSVATYGPSKAQNPALRLDKVGVIGLPLTSYEAQRISQHYKRGDEARRSPLNIPASQVSFENRSWNSFIQNVVSDACAGLGEVPGAEQPTFVFQRLEIFEVGSRLPPTRSIPQDGAFGTLLIILPSEFGGGSTVLSHRGLSRSEPGYSLHSITACAWYNTATREVKEIESGACAALVYDLCSEGAVGLPPTAAFEEIGRKLNVPLALWGSNVYRGPRLMAHIFEKAYSSLDMLRGGLVGVDLVAVQALFPIARQHGFRLALGTVVHHVFGRCNDAGTGFKDPEEARRTTGT